MRDHSQHGRGDQDGPEDPDCVCRGTNLETECAAEGCGFCSVASDIPDDVCCCGDSMENHESAISCGHSPVSMRDYYSSKK